MKLLTVILISVSCSAFSQTALEIYGGLSSSRLQGSGNADFSRRYSLQTGLLINILLDDKCNWRLKTGVGYSERGVRKRGKDINLNYVEIPLLLSYGSLIVDFYAGPQISYRTKPIGGIEKRDIGIAYGINIGLGTNLYTRLNFYQGFSDVFKNPDIKFRNGYICLAIGLRMDGYDGL